MHVSASLFHEDNGEFFATDELRAMARSEVLTSGLIQRAARGELEAARALHLGFWPFVHEFELAIDKHALARAPLIERFGRKVANSGFIGIAKAVRDMKEEEGSHAAHWRKDATFIGLSELQGDVIPGVRALVEGAYIKDHTLFFSVLAGTEFIAEELSQFLVGSPAYTALFGRKRWMWGEVHLAPHEDGPSHLDIDLDLARAYCADAGRAKEIIEDAVLKTIHLFGAAAADVEKVLLAADTNALAVAA